MNPALRAAGAAGLHPQPVDAGYPGDPPGPGLAASAAAQARASRAGAAPADDTTLARALAEGCGGFSMGTLHVALPMGALREVVPLTPLHCMPSMAPGLVGAIDLRGVMLPVLDLRRALCRVANDASYPCVVIMVYEGRLLGLLADGVTGVFGVAPGSFKHMPVQGGDPPLLAGSLRRADDGSLVSLLSPQALAAQPGMPMVEDPEPARSRQGAAADDVPAQALAVPMMLLQLGGLVLAIDAMAVHATLAAPVLERSVLAMGACRGVVNYLGDRVPVVDLLAHTGLGRLADGAPRELLLLRSRSGLVGLLVERVVDVVGVARGATVAVPAFALPRPALFAGALPLSALPEAMARLLSQQHGVAQCLELEGAALHDDEALCALASTQHGAAAGPAAPGDVTTTLIGRRAMVTFDLAGEAAVPIEQLAEILPLRTDGQPGAMGALGALVPGEAGRAGDSAVMGLVVDRGRSIPVLSLPRLAAAGDLPMGAAASVLVVQSGDDWVGFAVPRLRAIEAADWEPLLPAHGVGDADALTHTLRSRTLAQVGQGAEQRMLRVLDLAGIARALREGRLAA